jgi:Xaa-Pro aminopeptidase
VKGEHRPLEPGMVLTVEPGLYVAADDERADPRFRGIGVRIEDDLLVTPGGCENLSSSIPKAPDEVEALVAGA